jgi:hypothetical protein
MCDVQLRCHGAARKFDKSVTMVEPPTKHTKDMPIRYLRHRGYAHALSAVEAVETSFDDELSWQPSAGIKRTSPSCQCIGVRSKGFNVPKGMSKHSLLYASPICLTVRSIQNARVA